MRTWIAEKPVRRTFIVCLLAVTAWMFMLIVLTLFFRAPIMTGIFGYDSWPQSQVECDGIHVASLEQGVFTYDIYPWMSIVALAGMYGYSIGCLMWGMFIFSISIVEIFR